ncbi:hypothetical protein F8388_006248 [Cannabis sativa]|uniref:Cytochrome P450 n=1 Tax=Cannabis sativa TaxID=3483 RepID=A0A7J6G7H7_CANSA|nr:hypothetical protein F8388_006248 [Cannabis sativa]
MSEAQAELKHVIDKGNQVKDSDITRLPYLQAIVKELSSRDNKIRDKPNEFIPKRFLESDTDVKQ